MPVEFLQQEPSGGSSHATRLVMMYDGSGRRFSKTLLTRAGDSQGWDTTLVTHYTGIGTEIREYKPRNFVRYTDSAGVEHCVSANPDYGGNASTACPLPDTVKAVIPLPHGLGRYALQDVGQVNENGAPQAFEWYLKNHLGSTMVVYGTGFPDPLGISPDGELRAAYDYRSFGEQLDLLVFTRKVTENFTGKEKDDETQLDYFGARYLDPTLGMWISVDPARQFASPYLYVGNGMNSVNVVDPDGNVVHVRKDGNSIHYTMYVKFTGDVTEKNVNTFINSVEKFYTRTIGKNNITMTVVNNQENAENVIEFVNKKGQSEANTTFDKNYIRNYNGAQIFMLNEGDGARSSVHEAGHLMGLKDRYDLETMVPDEGYKGNVMGDKGDGLYPIQIDETMRKKGNTYENFDPYNGD